jgi:hypothetical protein
MSGSFSDYQNEMYAGGLAEKFPDITTDPTGLETAAERVLSRAVAEASGSGPRWFQLYRPNDDKVCRSFLHRAADAGFSTLVVTRDTWTLAWRPRDLDIAYLPFLRGAGTAVSFSGPAFRAGLAHPPEKDLGAAVGHWLPMQAGTDRGWDELGFVRQHWDGPILLKGSSTSPTRGRRSMREWAASSSPTTAAARWTVRSPRSTRCPGSPRRSGTVWRCCSTPEYVPAPTH